MAEAETWYDSFVEEENTGREAVRTAVLLAKTRFDEQLREFVGNSEERLGFVRGEVDRIADECAAMTGADRPVVFQKLMKVIEADVILPQSKPERVDLTADGEGSLPPERNADDAPEPTATTDVLDHEAVAEDAILDPEGHKIIPLVDGGFKHGCIRCNQHEASEGSPVCSECNTELVALAADDSPPLDGLESQPSEQFDEGDRVVFTRQEWKGVTGTVSEVRKTEHGSCYVVNLDEEVNGYLESPCFYPGAFVKAKGDLAGEGLTEAKVADTVGIPGAMQSQPQQQQQGPGMAQPMNPNAPYQCTVCHFTGTFNAVQDHINTAVDTDHMRAKQNQAPASPPGTAPQGQQPMTARVVDAADPTSPPAQGGETDPHDPVVDKDPQENFTPTGRFNDIVTAMADRAAARTFSTPLDEEIQGIAEQYGLDANDIRQKLIVRATFGDYTAVNGKVGESGIPEGYQEIQVQGIESDITKHQAIIPTNAAVRKVAEDLRMDEGSVYNAIKESMGDDLSSEYHTSVDGGHYFYLPAELAASTPGPPLDPQAAPPAQPAQGVPQPQVSAPVAAKLAKDLRIQALRMNKRARQLEAELVEGREAV